MIPIITTSGVDKVVAKLDLSGVAAQDPLAPFTKIVEDMMRVEAALFNSGGRRGGGSWKPLKPDTAKRKGSTQILVATGALRDSLSVPGAEYQILDISKKGFVFGTERPYAAVNNATRPIMKFTLADTSRWTNWLADHVMAPFHTK